MVKDVSDNLRRRRVEVHFQEAGDLGAPEFGSLDGEVEPGALGRQHQPAMVEAGVVVAIADAR